MDMVIYGIQFETKHREKRSDIYAYQWAIEVD